MFKMIPRRFRKTLSTATRLFLPSRFLLAGLLSTSTASLACSLAALRSSPRTNLTPVPPPTMRASCARAARSARWSHNPPQLSLAPSGEVYEKCAFEREGTHAAMQTVLLLPLSFCDTIMCDTALLTQVCMDALICSLRAMATGWQLDLFASI